MNEAITWNGCVYYSLDLIHQQMYARILQLEAKLKTAYEGIDTLGYGGVKIVGQVEQELKAALGRITTLEAQVKDIESMGYEWNGECWLDKEPST